MDTTGYRVLGFPLAGAGIFRYRILVTEPGGSYPGYNNYTPEQYIRDRDGIASVGFLPVAEQEGMHCACNRFLCLIPVPSAGISRIRAVSSSDAPGSELSQTPVWRWK